MTRLKEVEAQLNTSLKKARDAGIKLVMDRSLVTRKGRCIACCVIGSLFVEDEAVKSGFIGRGFNYIVTQTAEKLGLFLWEARAIACGWDGTYHSETDWVKVGARLRHAFKPGLSFMPGHA